MLPFHPLPFRDFPENSSIIPRHDIPTVPGIFSYLYLLLDIILKSIIIV